nr:hypothetical protein [Tanacetum cinerariifolium]
MLKLQGFWSRPDECFKIIVSNVLKNLKNPRQVVSGVQVGSKLGSKVQFMPPAKQVYQHVFKRNGASSSSIKKQAVLIRQDASNSNPFDALHTVENDDELAAKKVDDAINADNYNKVDEVHNETASFMASTSSKVNKSSKSGSGVGNKSLYEK